jgi:two-component system, LytTR family, response regulator
MRILIVDDEPLAREHLQRHLASEPGVEIVAQAANGLEALEQIAAHSPDVVFLDIEMPVLNGFEVLSNLASPPLIVFVTAYDEYAVRAFEAHAVDYILKPLQPERVALCVERLRALLGRNQPLSRDVMRQLLDEIRPTGPRRIAVKRANRIVLLSPREIIHVSAEDKLVFVHTAKERYSIEKTVTEMEESLRGAGFFRVNRGDLVNLDHVRELTPWFSGAWRVKLSTGAELDVSRDRVRHLKRELQL